jgi:hypothetical protein
MMYANTTELVSEIMRANIYRNPARIVARYKAITGSSFDSRPLPRITMEEMIQAVVAADATAADDVLSQLASD